MPPNPENPDFYSEHTQAANYGDGYYDSPPPEPPTPWYRRPVALIIAGVAGAGLLALVVALVYTQMNKPGQGPVPAPATSSATPTTTTAAESPRRHPPGGGGGGAPTQTVTETAPPSTDTPTTTAPASTTPASTTPASTAAPSTETSTVTQTVTVPTRRPFERP